MGVCVSVCSLSVVSMGAWTVYVISSVIAGIRLDHRSCEVLEAVLSRMQMTTLDLERTNLDDEVWKLNSFFRSCDLPLPLSSLPLSIRELLLSVR
jgi:hypothetical protein